jgi:hypothetical protein
VCFRTEFLHVTGEINLQRIQPTANIAALSLQQTGLKFSVERLARRSLVRRRVGCFLVQVKAPCWISVEAAVSAAMSTEMQATRLPLQYKTKAPPDASGGALN